MTSYTVLELCESSKSCQNHRDVIGSFVILDSLSISTELNKTKTPNLRTYITGFNQSITVSSACY